MSLNVDCLHSSTVYTLDLDIKNTVDFQLIVFGLCKFYPAYRNTNQAYLVDRMTIDAIHQTIMFASISLCKLTGVCQVDHCDVFARELLI